MKITVDRTPESEAVLNIELDWDELERASERAYKRLAQQYNVPGFRKGHAPRTMLERMLGKETIYQEGLEELIESSYRDAIKESALTPLAQPDLEAPPIALGQPYTYVARVPVMKPVTLGDYHAIHAPMPIIEVSDDEVNKTIENIRDNQAMWLPAERPAQAGDKIVADLKLTADDRQVSDLHDNEFDLTADERPGIFAGMDPHIIGMSEGETKEFTTTIPADYANPDLAGKEAHYVVTLKGVKYRELPQIDDELAKSAGEYDTLDELRAAIRQQMVSQKETEARREQREEAVKAAVALSDVDPHPLLVHDEVDVMLDEMKRMLERSRISFEQFLEMTNISESDYRKQIEPEAVERAKRDLVLDAIADHEGVTVSDEDIEGWLQVFTAMGGKRMRAKDLSRGQRVNIITRIRRDAALEHLVEIANANGEPTEAVAAAPTDAAPTDAAPTDAAPTEVASAEAVSATLAAAIPDTAEASAVEPNVTSSAASDAATPTEATTESATEATR